MKRKQFTGFNSFFFGGFECADHINRSGKRINLLEETQHHLRAREDYSLLKDVGIKVVREGICWSTVEKSPYVLDFSSLKPRIDAAKELGIQIMWDLCHFGYPDGLVPTHPLFPSRFMSLCRAFALFHKKYCEDPLLVVPINEISFLSWHSGDVRGTVPFAVNSGFDIKYHLCKAAIEGIKVLKQSDDSCKIILVEPLVEIHRGELEISNEELEELNSHQHQAMDIISGSLCPELGGSPDLFDMVGFNYYYNNQWEHEGPILAWPSAGNKMTPFSKLLFKAYKRYNKPTIITETGHFGDLRSQWLEEISLECDRAMSMGVDLRGICIYPVIDRPDWDDLNSWSNCGLWDLDTYYNRTPHPSSISSITKCVEFMETRKSSDTEKSLNVI
ncbi:hypothetical protein LZ575_05335 [Antarcticibacterium sp. 1MA-6-2]|uniref:hypothetical protein n=1 Tax=Antarcticibacterium sp. 1MA-6-2 TaxID=2908210 RepID=UPI001F4145F4|nr:hypothetical protein [Antarcticibacterium sp. 1MA-6-2]UJH92033.1 hypothetical protein LZ575_05335 [Antarcticibacterium sp. 1MA-6-2]